MQGKYGNLDASVVSYGPCQTPTLNFCVEQHQLISTFQSELFWSLRPHVSKHGQQYAAAASLPCVRVVAVQATCRCALPSLQLGQAWTPSTRTKQYAL